MYQSFLWGLTESIFCKQRVIYITGYYSRRVVEDLGYQFVTELFYADFTDENGVKIFKDIIGPEHKSCALLALRL